MPHRILIADDHIIVREGIKSLLLKEGFEVVAEASNGHEAVNLAAEVSPEIAVIDLAMPLLNGLDAVREIAVVSPLTKTVLLTMYLEDLYVVEALKAGVHGYLLKNQASKELIRAVQDVARGAIYLSPGISQSVVQESLTRGHTAEPLTPRERQVLQLVAEGKTTKEVAHILKIEVKTADSHRTKIMGKLDIHETAGLVRYAIRRGIIQP